MFRYILLASILILAIATRESSAATTHTIAAITSSLTWSPSTISISVGDSILFTNLGDGTHIPVALKGAKTNCSSSNEDTTLWTPPSTGTQFLAGPFSSDMTFFFKCRPHCSSGMTGQITVGTGGATTTTSTITTTKAASTSSASSTTKASTTTSSKTTTQGNSNGGGGGCFAADSSVRVRTASGAVQETKLAQVSRGDLVESFDAEGKQVFSRVYFVAHRNSPAQVPLLEFVLSGSASSLKLTANHLLLGTEGSFLPASAFKPGDLVWVRSQASTDLKPALILSINKAVGPIRAALTLNDNILVSEVAASVFVESQWLYQILAAPLKFFDAHFPSLLDENSLLTSLIDLLVDMSDWIEAFLPHSTAAHSLALAAIRS